jgi:hypothetical protein
MFFLIAIDYPARPRFESECTVPHPAEPDEVIAGVHKADMSPNGSTV